MQNAHWIWSTNQRIPSERGAGQDIAEEILAALREAEWDEKDIFGVRLSLEEALVNAIIHGNRLDNQKSVTVDCKMSTEKLWIEITDEGPGFHPEEVPDPTAPENLERPCGRGIMLMRNFMSFVEYSPRGNRVTMEKQRSAEDDKAAGENRDG